MTVRTRVAPFYCCADLWKARSQKMSPWTTAAVLLFRDIDLVAHFRLTTNHLVLAGRVTGFVARINIDRGGGRDKWVGEWMSEEVVEWVSHSVSESVSGWVVGGWVSKSFSQWISEWVSEWVSEEVNEWMSQLVSQSGSWVGGWVNDWVIQSVN